MFLCYHPYQAFISSVATLHHQSLDASSFWKRSGNFLFKLEGEHFMPTLPLVLTFIAAALNGLLAGASLDQSLKQLPARHRMGTRAFSLYSRSADLSPNGIIWYASLGISAAVVTIAAAVAALVAGNVATLPIVLAAILSVLHSIATAQAAPTNFRQQSIQGDEAALARVFDTFERWQTVRAILQALTFAATLWAIFVLG
jgi:hypothetical protein